MNQADKLKQAKFHLPIDLHSFLKHAAIENHRSMNAEVVFRLMQTRAREAADLVGAKQ